jgi:hypothetical protein
MTREGRESGRDRWRREVVFKSVNLTLPFGVSRRRPNHRVPRTKDDLPRTLSRSHPTTGWLSIVPPTEGTRPSLEQSPLTRSASLPQPHPRSPFDEGTPASTPKARGETIVLTPHPIRPTLSPTPARSTTIRMVPLRPTAETTPRQRLGARGLTRS